MTLMQDNYYLNAKKADGRTVVIGDIHGCFLELQQLLKEIDFTPKDILIAVGDLVDRGPASWDVVRFFHDTPNAWSVLGNHERRLVRSVEGRSQPAWTQLQTLARAPEKDRDVLLEYLSNLPGVIETPVVIVTHAQLDPDHPLDKQDPHHCTAVGFPGSVIPLDEEGIPIWYRKMAAQRTTNKPICIGHVGYQQVELVPGGLYCLDTGAVQAGKLTALVVEERQIIQVPVLHNYKQEARQQWLEQQYAQVDPWELPFLKVQELMKKRRKHQTLSSMEERTLEAFIAAFNTLSFNERLQVIRKALLNGSEDLPAAGSERGEVFQAISCRFPKELARYIRFSLSNHPRTVESLLTTFFSEKNLAEVEDLLKRTEVELCPGIENMEKRGYEKRT